jgi:kinesin family protein 2/24
MLLAYGQTGSGKTFTVSGMEQLVVEKLMDGKVSGKWDVHMCIFEVAGSNMYGTLSSMADPSLRHPLTGPCK